MDRLSFSRTISLLGALFCSGLMVGCGMVSTPEAVVEVSSTQNPLVAQFMIGSSCKGQAMVEFGRDLTYGRNTSWYTTSGHFHKTNILVAGMEASTTYHMRGQLQCEGKTAVTEDVTFATGALPATPFPTLKVTRPNPSLSSSENPGIEMLDLIAPTSGMMESFFTDREGTPLWYYDVGANNSPFTIKLLPNGHMILSIQRPDTTILREVDLAGNTIREIDAGALGQQVLAAGFGFGPEGFHHDVLPLDNGHLIVLMVFNKPFTDLAGYPGTIQVAGDALIDLDQNWNPVWAWNSFDHLDVNRHLAGLPDWTHSNAVVYSASDGNLLLSMRHQSWVIKIDYQNGAGTGNVLWRLGYQGDFALAQGDDPTLWFSFQHFPSLINQTGSQTTMTIWDNGDFRPLDSGGTVCPAVGPPPCYSRATVFQVDESAKVADLLWADLPGLFSVWGGSINQLANGNVEFDLNAPILPPTPNVASEIQEVTQTSTPEVVWQMDISPIPMYAYRAYRVPSLYPGVTWQQ